MKDDSRLKFLAYLETTQQRDVFSLRKNMWKTECHVVFERIRVGKCSGVSCLADPDVFSILQLYLLISLFTSNLYLGGEHSPRAVWNLLSFFVPSICYKAFISTSSYFLGHGQHGK